MNKLLLIPIILGGTLLLAGGVLLTVAIASNANTPLVTEEKTINEAFANIDVDIETSDLEFKVSEDDKTKVVFKETELEHHTAEVSENTLKIRFIDERPWYKRIFSGFKRISATVYLPAGNYGDLKVRMSTGDANIAEEFTFANYDVVLSTGHVTSKANVTNEFKLETSTGNIDVLNAKPKSMNVKASTGDVKLQLVEVENTLTINTSTGYITFEDTKCKDLNVSASTGKITLTRTIVDNHIEIETSTGDVTFDHSDAASLKIKTTTGDVRGTFNTNKIIYAQSKTGDIDVPHLTEGGICEITTSTGDVYLRII